MSDTRNRQVMVRLSDEEYAALIHAAEAEDRKPADMLRVYMKRAQAAHQAAKQPAQQVIPHRPGPTIPLATTAATPEPQVTPIPKSAPAKRRA